MAADSTTDDTKENQQNGEGDAITGSSNDAPVIDLGVDTQPHQQVDSKDFLSFKSKDMENEKAASLHLGMEATKGEKERLPRCDSKTLDGTDLGVSNQHGSDRTLEVKGKHEKAQQQTVGMTGVELAVGSGTKEMVVDNGSTAMESSSVLGAKEGKLMGEVKESGPFPNNETKDKSLCQDMHGLELATKTVINKELGTTLAEMEIEQTDEVEEDFVNPEQNAQTEAEMKTASNMLLPDKNTVLENESESEENQAVFMKELEAFHKERFLEFKPPKFYGEPLNCLKLWRAVIKLGGYEQVTACKLWRQVGESFNPPKTCTTVSWTFRGFYEKALLEYEKHKMRSGELPFSDASFTEPSGMGNQAGLSQASGSGRARRDAAARAMQGWHSQRLLGNGEVGDPIIKDKNLVPTPKREKQLKSVGLLKRKKLSPVDHPLQIARMKASKPQLRSLGSICLTFCVSTEPRIDKTLGVRASVVMLSMIIFLLY
ncbi:hypothetical protein ACH5RR_002526 [Cinchona calisaya]|uniref:ARID domain-containing protein n=1 Tax=Cinchona calisaya TaxID=153742 RepID=A0ABD3B6H5_9GENT